MRSAQGHFSGLSRLAPKRFTKPQANEGARLQGSNRVGGTKRERERERRIHTYNIQIYTFFIHIYIYVHICICMRVYIYMYMHILRTYIPCIYVYPHVCRETMKPMDHKVCACTYANAHMCLCRALVVEWRSWRGRMGSRCLVSW